MSLLYSSEETEREREKEREREREREEKRLSYHLSIIASTTFVFVVFLHNYSVNISKQKKLIKFQNVIFATLFLSLLLTFVRDF